MKTDPLHYNVPYYDVATDTIHNAYDGDSYTFNHELRHKQQNEIKCIRWFNLYYGSVLIFFAPLFFIGYLIAPKGLAELFLWLFLLSHMIKYGLFWVLEIDAVIYGNRKQTKKE